MFVRETRGELAAAAAAARPRRRRGGVGKAAKRRIMSADRRRDGLAAMILIQSDRIGREASGCWAPKTTLRLMIAMGAPFSRAVPPLARRRRNSSSRDDDDDDDDDGSPEYTQGGRPSGRTISARADLWRRPSGAERPGSARLGQDLIKTTVLSPGGRPLMAPRATL